MHFNRGEGEGSYDCLGPLLCPLDSCKQCKVSCNATSACM